MTRVGTHADPQGAAFRENAEAFEGLLEDLRSRSAEARRGGGEKARLRHEGRGKLPVRDRVEMLLDPGPPSWSSRRSPPTGCTTGGCRPRAW
jgi:hypothetical protein